MELEDLSAISATCDLKIVRRSGDHSGTTGFGLFTWSSKPLLAYAFRVERKIHTHRRQGDSTTKITNTGQAIISARSTIHICKYFNAGVSIRRERIRLARREAAQASFLPRARIAHRHYAADPNPYS